MSAGFPNNKINMGLALFGKAYKLVNYSDYNLGSVATILGLKENVLYHIF